MAGHDWTKSTLGHGDATCRRCHITNREAAALGLLNRCELPPSPAENRDGPAVADSESGMHRLPDGSGFFTASFPLPKDHWIFETTSDGFTGPPPMPLRSWSGSSRDEMVTAIWAAAKYAIRASTRCGRENDFDPDAMAMNMVVGLLGPEAPNEGGCNVPVDR